MALIPDYLLFLIAHVQESNRLGTSAAFAQEMHWPFGDGSIAISCWDIKTKGAARAYNCLAWNQNTVGSGACNFKSWKVVSSDVSSLCLFWRLGFLEPPAFEEGILERYPIFLSIVLNQISDDSGEFSYAVNCLRLLFEMLGTFSWALPLFLWCYLLLLWCWLYLLRMQAVVEGYIVSKRYAQHTFGSVFSHSEREKP